MSSEALAKEDILFSANVQAAPAVSLEELLANTEEYDGKKVLYRGEVIGDIMIRGKFAWINVRDKTGTIGIFCPQELINKIKHQGSYRFTGDIISTEGTFNFSCSLHGGDSDIHADKITVIQKGKELVHFLGPQKVKASIVLPAIVFALAIVHLIVRKFR